MTCQHCGHPEWTHFITDESGHRDQQPCVETYGSGRWRCKCVEWEASRVRVTHG